MKYGSKRDWWICALLWGSVIPCMVLVVYLVLKYERPMFYLVTTGLVVGLVAWIWFDTGYLIGDRCLFIRSGPIRKKVPYDGITSVKKTNNPFSTAALSIDRIEIKCEEQDIIISPKDADSFISEISKKCPHLCS